MTFVCERTFAARLHAGFFLFLSWWFRLSLRRSTSGEPHWRCGAPKGVAGSNPVSHPRQVPGSATTGGLRRCRCACEHLPSFSSILLRGRYNKGMSTMLQIERSDYLTTKEAAARLGVSDARIRQLLLEGRISGLKVGETAWLVPLKEVERYSRERRPVGRPSLRK